MKNNIKNKIISLVLSFCLIFTMSVTCLAAEAENPDTNPGTEETTDVTETEASGEIENSDESEDSTNPEDSGKIEDSDESEDSTNPEDSDEIGNSDEIADSDETADLPAPNAPVISKIIRKKLGNTKVYWSAVKGASSYEIQTSENIDFSDATTTIVSKGTSTLKTIKGLSKTNDTYVRMRTLVTTEEASAYSPWSNVCRMIVFQKSWKYASRSKIHTGTAVLFYTTAENKKDLTIAVNAGHGTKGGSSKRTLCHPDGSRKVTGGSTSAGSKYATAINEGTRLHGHVSEATQNLKVAKATKSQLLAAGYNVLMIRQESDVQLDNIARTVIANHYANAHISIHYDSTSSNKGAFAITVPKSSRYRKMEPVKSHYAEHNALASKLISGLKAKGVKIWRHKYMALDLTQTSYSTIPSIDLEVGDRSTSRSATTVKKMAIGILKGVNAYFTMIEEKTTE